MSEEASWLPAVTEPPCTTASTCGMVAYRSARVCGRSVVVTPRVCSAPATRRWPQGVRCINPRHMVAATRHAHDASRRRFDMSVPNFGLGTFRLKDQVVKDSVRNALEVGYRAIDTAQGYGNEGEIGEVIAQSGVPRSELYLTTKI